MLVPIVVVLAAAACALTAAWSSTSAVMLPLPAICVHLLAVLELHFWQRRCRFRAGLSQCQLLCCRVWCTGGSHEGYVKWACVAAASRGWRAVVLNMRGCNGLPLTSARGYNAINTADVHVAVQSIHRCVKCRGVHACVLAPAAAACIP